MAAPAHTFSESWYRIAGKRVALRPHVRVQRQYFRGERFHVLHDPFNNQFFRLRPAAYEFVARLRRERTVGEVWQECLEARPEEAPGQEDVVRLLSQLYSGNLLLSDLSPDSAQLFERFRKRRRRETRATVLNAMSARFPLWDPDRFLRKIDPAVRRALSTPFVLVWLGVIAAAIKVLVDHSAALADQSQGVLSPGNLPLLLVASALIKLLHEFGHACACRRLGGEVHVMGIMLMIFTPMPYVDTTSSWAFRSRWHRAVVGAAGMIVELFVAALAVFVWAHTGPGSLHSLAYNAIFVAGVSTLFFNLNPLLRFDGYYILSDLLEIPNLQLRSQQQLTHLAERWLFGCRTSRSPAMTRQEAFWLAAYGLASTTYRTVLFLSIVLFLSDRALLLGVLMAIGGVVSWFALPAWRLTRYLASSPRIARRRPRAVAICAGGAVVPLLILAFVPAPSHFRAPGVVEATERSVISAEASGRVSELIAAPDAGLARGVPLVRLENAELELRIAEAAAQLDEIEALWQRAFQEGAADLEALESRRAAVRQGVDRLKGERTALLVHAPHAGRWIAPELPHLYHAWLPRGEELGQVVNPASYRFSAVVSQDDASRLFAGEIRGAEVRLPGRAGPAMHATLERIIPAEQRTLPSAALGWQAGGEVALAASHEHTSGAQAKEAFFSLTVKLDGAGPLPLWHGQSGTVRLTLRPEPLLPQWWRKLRQAFQRRFDW
jgi:putative peptide zinc metalloprotease protein